VLLQPTETANIQLQVGANVRVFPIGVEVSIQITARPDPKRNPVEVEAAVSGYFRRPEGASDATLIEFARTAGVFIVFPYVREAISNVTSRTAFGAVWLSPLDVFDLTLGEAEQDKRSKS
jgi:preprotein translocase subunit SecB